MLNVFYKMMNRKRKGFTLIELIVVIAILGILAAVAIPRLSGFSEKARIKADIATFEIIDKSIAIAVAEGTLTGGTGIVAVLDVGSGTVTWDDTATTADTAAVTITNIMGTLIQASPKFELAGNQTLANVTWDIAADGTITSPAISAAGVITP